MASTSPSLPVPSTAAPQASPAADQTPSIPSPAPSDKTVVPTIVEPKTAHLAAMHGDGAVSAIPTRHAYFSTHFGRRPKREPGPYPLPPVIVRSHRVEGVVEYARFWYRQHPYHRHHFFPNTGWTIEDLWDGHDIHLNSPGFLREVLAFITRDNYYLARNFAVEWSEKRPDLVTKVGMEMKGVYDTSNDEDIIGKIFTDEDKKRFPPLFLWHVANLMRFSMYKTILKHQESTASAEATVKVTEKAEGNITQKVAGDTGLSAQRKAPAATATKQPAPERLRGSGSRAESTPAVPLPASSGNGKQGPTIPPPSAIAPPYPPVQMSQISQISQMPQMPQISQMPQIGYPQPAGPGMAAHSPRSSPYMQSVPLRSQKIRYPRPPSGSYPHPAHQRLPSGAGWAENISSGQLSRQPSYAPMSATQSPAFQSVHPAQPMMNMNPVNAMHPMVQTPAMLPHLMPYNGQVPYPPMVQANTMQQPAIPFGPPVLAPGYQYLPHGLNGQEHMHVPIGNTTNNANLQRDPRFDPNMNISNGRRPSRGEKSLYNPYPTTRPDFANVPTQQMGRKAGRNSTSNGHPRDRRFSLGPQNRNIYPTPVQDQTELVVTNPTVSRQLDTRIGSSIGPITSAKECLEPDPTITGDSVYGCDDSWIGPENSSVVKLWIGGISDKTTFEDVRLFFQKGFDITIVMFNPTRDKTYGWITFLSSKDATKGLRADGHQIDGRIISVKVPHSYYCNRKPVSGYESRSGARGPQEGIRRFSYAPKPSKADGAQTTMPNPSYSPQDVRSTIQPSSEQPVVPTGSPEARKSKKNSRSPKKLKCEPNPKNNTSVNAESVPGMSDRQPVIDKAKEHVDVTEKPVQRTDDIEPLVSSLVPISTTAEDEAPVAEEVVPLKPTVARSEPLDSPARTVDRVDPLVVAQTTSDEDHNASRIDSNAKQVGSPGSETDSANPSAPIASTDITVCPPSLPTSPTSSPVKQPKGFLRSDPHPLPSKNYVAGVAERFSEPAPESSPLTARKETEACDEAGAMATGGTQKATTTVRETSTELGPDAHNMLENSVPPQPRKEPSPPESAISSEDDQKHDISFHSAQESQPEPQQDTALASSGPNMESECTAHLPTTDSTAPPQEEKEGAKADPNSKQNADPVITAADAITIDLRDAGATASSITSKTRMDLKATKDLPPAEKKPGPKQTESLNPFAKAKALKEAEKKAKRKEKKKSKVEKTAPVSKPTAAAVTPNASDITPSAPSPVAASLPMDLFKTDPVFNMLGPKLFLPVLASKAQLDDGQSRPTSPHEQALGRLSARHALHDGGIASAPVADHEVKTQTQRRAPQPRPDLEASKPEDLEARVGQGALSPQRSTCPVATSEAADPPVLVSASSKPPKASTIAREAPNETKSVRNRIAVPSIDLLNRNNPPSGRGPLSSGKPTSSIENTSTTSALAGDNELHSSRERSSPSAAASEIPNGVLKTGDRNDIASVASDTTSATLTGTGSPPLMSPSPTVEHFYTPAQTPVAALAPSQSDLSAKDRQRLKKRKANQETRRRKKALEKAAEELLLGTAGTEEKGGPLEDAFSYQMAHIEGLSDGTSQDGASYYDRDRHNYFARNQHKETPDKVLGLTIAVIENHANQERKAPASLARQVGGLVEENEGRDMPGADAEDSNEDKVM